MADAHKGEDHGQAAHGHGDEHDHGHGHETAAGDIIPEDSPQDMLLTALAMLTCAGLLVMMFWFYQPGGEPPAHGGHHGAGAETQTHGTAPAVGGEHH